jgi:anthranilate phosphoribosyltransferase
MSLLPHLHKVCTRRNLSLEEAQAAMHAILNGEASTPQIAAFLSALLVKGEAVEEVAGLALAMLSRAEQLPRPAEGPPIVDTCGTGGDGAGTFNISTTVAFVVAGAGARVAKHGNRAISSRSGSADILEALGVNLQLSVAQLKTCFEQAGIAFLFAPLLHPAMKNAQAARLELKMRTTFNLLGPLTNPMRPDAQVIGASTFEGALLLSQALGRMEAPAAYVVHGSDGLDELTTTAATMLYEIRGASVTRRAVKPETFGLAPAQAEALLGGDPLMNRDITLAILQGERGPKRDIVLMNASAVLTCAGLAADFPAGVALAEKSIDSGAAMAKLELLRSVSNGV